MARDSRKADLDRELVDLAPEMRWREWMYRIEAVLFASATPVARDDLARVVGQGASVDLLIEDLAIDLAERPYEISRVGMSWTLRTKPAYAPVIRAAADVEGRALDLNEFDLAVLAVDCHGRDIRLRCNLLDHHRIIFDCLMCGAQLVPDHTKAGHGQTVNEDSSPRSHRRPTARRGNKGQ